MLRYALRRLLIAIPTLLGITIITFSIISLAPGDPASIKLGEVQDPRVSERLYAQLREQFELDRPLPVRYANWLGRTVRGNFGNSFFDGRPVLDKIVERIPATASLAALSLLIGLSIAVPLGLYQASRQDGWFDTVTSTLLYMLYAVPGYVMAVVLIYFAGVKWDLLPFRGMTSDDFSELSFLGKIGDYARHFALITACYTYHEVCFDSRFVRQTMLEVMRQDYVRTARAKGLPEWKVVLKHAFRNTFIPLVTRLGSMLPLLISGSVILEVIFNWPGVGRLFFEGILQRDYPLIMANTVISATLVLAGILLADLAYAWADPRISHE